MKILERVLVYLGLTLASIVALLFTFVEWRSLFAGDFLLFNNPFLGALSYFLRGLYFLLILTLCVFIVLFRTHHKKICIILFAGAVSLLVGAFFTLLFYEYYVSLVIILVTSILVAITAVGFFKKVEQPCSIE